jgi:GNAT superfamily N-acetyltransferase
MAVALSGHMRPDQRTAFEDKLKRYADKPDRDLYMAGVKDRIVGFGCVIDKSPALLNQPFSSRPFFNTHASITGLMVLPPFRRLGLGMALVRQMEAWARDRNREGIWLVTHRMAAWYQTHFGYGTVGHITVKKVKKTVMVRYWG